MTQSNHPFMADCVRRSGHSWDKGNWSRFLILSISFCCAQNLPPEPRSEAIRQSLTK